MTTTESNIQRDIQTIKNVLKAAHRLASSMRRGGLSNLYHESRHALDALDRIAEEVLTRQLWLFQEVEQ